MRLLCLLWSTFAQSYSMLDYGRLRYQHCNFQSASTDRQGNNVDIVASFVGEIGQNRQLERRVRDRRAVGVLGELSAVRNESELSADSILLVWLPDLPIASSMLTRHFVDWDLCIVVHDWFVKWSITWSTKRLIKWFIKSTIKWSIEWFIKRYSHKHILDVLLRQYHKSVRVVLDNQESDKA